MFGSVASRRSIVLLGAVVLLTGAARFAPVSAERENDAVSPSAVPTPSPVDRPVQVDRQAEPVFASVSAARAYLQSEDVAKNAHEDDLLAAREFYAGASVEPMWLSGAGLSAGALAVVAEIKQADTWGLEASAFVLPDVDHKGLSDQQLGEADAKISLSVLKYVRYARGGRVRPRKISRFIDHTPELKEPVVILNQIRSAASQDEYLRSQHPKHVQYLRLRDALAKVRAEQAAGNNKINVVEQIVVPDGPTIRPGKKHAQIPVLRRRLKVASVDGPKADVYDTTLVKAVQEFQRAHGLNAAGIVGPRTRASLNGRGGGSQTDRLQRKIQQIIINMERWRWVPRSLGAFYVWDNIPEFRARVIKAGEEIYSSKMIVGKTTNPTPAFSAEMKYVIFHPSWGVPNGIKRTEILPYLKRSSGFFGFGGADTTILRQHNLTVTRNGRPVDASKVNWSKVDIRNYHFSQPPGRMNVLGKVKFRFPNSHDVYMHDTPERHLFKKRVLTLSHGCMRVHEPRRLAEVILKEDKGWSTKRVGQLWAGGGNGNVELTTQIPVHVMYLTARVDDQGNLKEFRDVYGYDRRVVRALGRKPATFKRNPAIATSESGARPRKKKRTAKRRKDNHSVADVISNQFSP